MFALIYDELTPGEREKKVLSLHTDRKSAERALVIRRDELGKKILECHTRIVWLRTDATPGETITPNLFDTWAPNEEIPESEKVPDSD
ncbi:MAG: hypothetical protein LJE94_00465 [Deltaproteobacteria bacterium]|nr:hypothetical protein [Deltaproteobacteria bacterium]